MFIGLLAGLTTCALWGLTFVAPRAVAPYSTLDLTVARYAVFGLASLALMVLPRFRPTGLSPSRWIVGLSLGGFGYVGYFVAAGTAVTFSGAAIPPLVIGTMPVLLALIANAREATVPWRAILLPLSLILAGVLLVNVSVLDSAGTGRRVDVLLGTASAVIALLIWVAYGLLNAAVMRAADAPDALRWTGVQGIGAAVGSLALLPTTGFATTEAPLESFVAWSLALGIAGSWLATWCWAVASKRLPLALAAQLIVAETIFGLAYGFLFEARWPSVAEWAGGSMQVSGVVLAIAAFAGTAARNTASVPSTAIGQSETAGPLV